MVFFLSFYKIFFCGVAPVGLSSDDNILHQCEKLVKGFFAKKFFFYELHKKNGKIGSFLWILIIMGLKYE
jgi:hypothetical protein